MATNYKIYKAVLSPESNAELFTILNTVASGATGGATEANQVLGISELNDIATNTSTAAAKNADWEQYEEKVNLVTASDIGAADGVIIDQGAEIDCRGYNAIGIWVDFTVNNSLTNAIEVLSKHTTAGAGEYVLEDTDQYQKVIGNTNIKSYYLFDVTGISFIQIRSSAGTVGATKGTLTIDITKEY